MLPQNLPHSALVNAIQSPRVRALFDEERALRAKRAELRERMRALLTRRDTIVREMNELTDIPEVNQAIDELYLDKNLCHAALAEIRAEQDVVERARSSLRLCSFECKDLAKAVSDASLLLQSAEAELRRVRASPASAQKEKALAAQVQLYAQQHAAKQREKEAKDVAYEDARRRLEALCQEKTPEERHAEFKRVSQHMTKVLEQLGKLRGKRQEVSRAASGPLDATRRDEAKLRAELRTIDARLTAIRRSELPSQHFTYPAAHRNELIGTQGTTLCQLQLDFGVALCVDGVPNGTGFVIGSEEAMRDCVDAIEAIMEHAEQRSLRREIAYDESLRRHLIGPRGSTVESLERESGARVRLLDDGVVEIIGTNDALQRAEVLIRSLLDSFSSGEMNFEASQIGSVIGRGGETIQMVERVSGLRGVRVDRAHNKILFSGSTSAIAKAKALYQEILGVSAEGAASGGEDITVTLHAEERVVRAVVGHRGAQVRELEQSTGTRIQCSGTTITVTGARTAVEAATSKIEALRRTETRLVVDARTMTFLTAPTVFADEAPAEDALLSTSAASRCSVLEAVKEAVGCDAVVPLRAEGCVIVRGRPLAVQQATMMLRQLMVRNKPVVVRMPYLDVLRPALLQRPEGSAQRLLDQFCAAYSPLLRVELDRDRRLLMVSSFDADEVKAAAAEMKTLLTSLTNERVRVLRGVPVAQIGLVIGPQGSTIRALQSETGTQLSVVREEAEIQIYSPSGDQAALEAAEEKVKELLGMTAASDGNGTGDDEDGEAIEADASVGVMR